MRDQIAKLVKEIRYRPSYSDKQSWQFADQILALISEEIEKAENPHRRLDNGYYVGFDDCRQKILSLFK